jgi:hypothetical protein
MRGLAILALLVSTASAMADESSTYTKLDFKDTKACADLTPAPVEGEPNDGVAYECKGFGDYVVSFSEGDLRSTVSFGTRSGDHCAGRQSFGGFNSIGNTIEWRLHNGMPIATILRWSVSYDPEDSVKQKEWLVVTKLEADNSCHMGYVEGAYPNANAAAQKLADGFADGFACTASKPIIIAKIGTATEGIAANDGCRP